MAELYCITQNDNDIGQGEEAIRNDILHGRIFPPIIETKK